MWWRTAAARRRAAAAVIAAVAVQLADAPGTRTLADPSAPIGAPRRPREQLPSSPQGFDKMWQAHPHDHRVDASQNTSNEALLEEHGLPEHMEHTCAIRLSVMLNKIDLPITPSKTKAAGLERRPYYSEKTKQYYILSAREMWTYLGRYYRAPDHIVPASGKHEIPEEFQEAFDSTIKPIISGRKGIVAFERVFDYDGTGHVDLFDGEALSDASTWFPAARLHVWYVVTP